MARPWVIAGLHLIWAIVASAGEPLQVEDRGEPRKFHFAGLQTFIPEQIAGALETDVEFLLAAHPRASFARMLEALQEKLTLGYQHVGFPRASVKAYWDGIDDRASVSIEEGPRYRAGRVEVIGAHRADADKLAAWIVAKTLPQQAQPADAAKRRAGGQDKDTLQWKAGEPVSFVPWTWKKYETRVKSGLAAQGFHFAKFQVSVATDDMTTAKLLVTIEDEGPAGVIDVIKVVGSERYPPEQIMAYLNLTRPLQFDVGLQSRIYAELRASGRFLWQQVELPPPDEPDGPMKLTIKLRDNVADVTPLGEEFTRAERAMFKLAQWVENAALRNDDLVIRARGEAWLRAFGMNGSAEMEFIISPSEGAYCRVTTPADVHAPRKYELLLSPEQLVLMSMHRGECLQVASPWRDAGNKVGITANLQLKGDEKPKKNGSQVSLVFGCGITHDPQGGVPPVRLNIGYDPAAALYNLYRQGTEIVFDASRLIVRQDHSTIEVDEASGKLLRCEFQKEDPPGQFSLTASHGALTARREELEHTLKGSTNAWDGRLPLTSVARYVTDELVYSRSGQTSSATRPGLPIPRRVGLPVDTLPKRQSLVLKRLLERACQTGDEWIATADWKSNQDEFSLPPPQGNPTTGWLQMVAGPLLKASSICFPYESPPWTLSRETAFMLAGKSPYAKRELDNVLGSPSTGPISGLYAAALFRYINPDLSRQFARRSLFRTEPRYFRHDLEWLLSSNSIARRPLLAAAGAVRGCTREELRLLVSLVDGESYVRRDPGQSDAIYAALLPLTDPMLSTEAALPSALEALWEAALKQHVERWLQLLCQQGLTGNG